MLKKYSLALVCLMTTAAPGAAQVSLDTSYTDNAGSIARNNIGNRMVERRTRAYHSQRRSPSQTASIARAKCANAHRSAASGNGDPTLLRMCARAGYR